MFVVQIAPPWLSVPPRAYGGTEYMAGLLVEGLHAAGTRVHLFCQASSLAAPFDPIPFPFGSSPDKYSENAYLAECTRRLTGMAPDLVHSHLETFAGFARSIGRRWPVVVTLHIPISRPLSLYLAQFNDVTYVVPGRMQMDLLVGMVPDVVYIPHGIPVDRYDFEIRKKDYLLFLGRISPTKGVEDAVALSRVLDRPLVIAGPVFPADESYFKEIIAPQVDGERVRYVGEVDFWQKNQWLSRAVALVHPVKVEEAFGLTLVEAMACGTPVLAYQRGAVGDVVQDGVTGRVVHNLPEMAAAWDDVMRLDPEVCRRHVEEHFSRESMVRNYLDLYDRLI